MKATRKLIPAIAMLLISAVMMSTATFAWFSTNEQVAANGMTVKATSSSTFIVISTGMDADINSTYVDINNEAKAVQPTRVEVGAGKFDWYTATSSKQGVSNAKGESGTLEFPTDYTPVGTAESLTNVEATYALKTTVYIHAKAGFPTAEYLYVKNIECDGAGAFKNAVSVALVVNGYADADAAEAGTKTTVYADYENCAASDTQLSAYVGEELVQVDIYVYINGEHSNVISDNAIAANLGDLSVDVTFGVGDPTP